MTKVIIYILDRFVCFLLVTVIATQALQIAGIVETPKSSIGEIAYSNENEFNYQMAVGDNDVRFKRQTQSGDNRSPFIDSLFNMTTRFTSCMMMKRVLKKQKDHPEMLTYVSIRSAMTRIVNILVARAFKKRCPDFENRNTSIPISTLNALNNLVQSSRPMFRKLREYAQKRFEKTTKAPETENTSSNKTIIRLQRAYPIFIRPKEQGNKDSN